MLYEVITGGIKENVKNIEALWNKLFAGNPYDYFFLDVYYDEQFKADKRFGNVFGIFSFLAIFITCLGLFGLSLYTANLKTKEIGIRNRITSYNVCYTKLLRKFFSILLKISFLIEINRL